MLASLAVSLVEPVISSVVKVEEELEEQEEDSWKNFFSSTPSFNNINVTNYFNDEPRFNGVQETTYLKKKMNRMPQIAMIKIVMEYIGVYYLLVEILLHFLILLELNIFPKKY